MVGTDFSHAAHRFSFPFHGVGNLKSEFLIKQENKTANIQCYESGFSRIRVYITNPDPTSLNKGIIILILFFSVYNNASIMPKYIYQMKCYCQTMEGSDFN